MTKQELFNAWQDAQRRCDAAPKGYKTGWQREVRRLATECLKAGV